MNKFNLLNSLPSAAAAEQVAELWRQGGTRVERIVSAGQVSPPGFWYDQDEHEWVMLLLGSAQLEFEDGARVELEAGDSLLIPAHRLHRVSRTSVEPVAVWLAVFCAVAD